MGSELNATDSIARFIANTRYLFKRAKSFLELDIGGLDDSSGLGVVSLHLRCPHAVVGEEVLSRVIGVRVF